MKDKKKNEIEKAKNMNNTTQELKMDELKDVAGGIDKAAEKNILNTVNISRGANSEPMSQEELETEYKNLQENVKRYN